MRRTLLIAAFLAPALAAQANEGFELQQRSKALAALSVPTKQAEAPFRTARDPMPELLLNEELERRGPKGACEHNATSLCYDLADGRVVYRPARQYMPKVDGLRAESLSLRHNRVVLKYSFR